MAERTSNETGNLSLQTKNRFPRDLMQSSTGSVDGRGSDPNDEIELNLGLSLGGRFGVDKSKLVRASSVAAILPVVKDDDVSRGSYARTGYSESNSGLTRTSSLPVETEEWKKRKDLQSLRRLAVKQRRLEKQMNSTKVEKEEYVASMGRVGTSVRPPMGSANWYLGGETMAASSGGGVGGFTPPSLLGSVESQASSISEFESRHLQGSGTEGEVSLASVQSGQERSNQDSGSSSRSKVAGPSRSHNNGKEIRSNTVDMPCVFAQGDRRIEGILYKYGKGEEVKIMCVCHGSFLSPAEFVKHAGLTDVVHPLKHIVVNPNSSYL